MDKNKVKEFLKECDKEYYNNNNSIISDTEYDNLVKLVEHNNTIGYKPNNTNYTIYRHLYKMYSMDNVYNQIELNKWLKRFKEEDLFCITPKYDGVSLNLLYRDNKLVLGATRGNGIEGEIVTNNIQLIPSIPSTIKDNRVIEIRGEVFISKEDFNSINTNGEFSNPRNLASATIRQLVDPNLVIERKLQFIPYDIKITTNDTFITYQEQQLYLVELDFNKHLFIDVVNKEQIQNIYIQLQQLKEKYPLDGIVIISNNLKINQELGYTIKYPKFNIAYKFPPEEIITKLLDIELQIGRTGTITPVGILEPIVINGVTISKVTLHNFNYIKSIDLRIGDLIGVIRSGDVIPKITKVYTDKRKDNLLEYDIPNLCPCCNNTLEFINSSLCCVNKYCKDVLISKFTYIVSRKCLNVRGVSVKMITTLVESNSIKTLYDLLKCFNITNISLDKFILCLCINNISDTASIELSKLGKEVFNYTKEEIMNKNNKITELIANNFILYVNENKDTINNCLQNFIE